MKSFWIIFSVSLIGVVAAQFFIRIYGHFDVESWFGFGAWYGFLSCVGMVVFAKCLGLLIKRPDDYYLKTKSEETERKSNL